MANNANAKLTNLVVPDGSVHGYSGNSGQPLAVEKIGDLRSTFESISANIKAFYDLVESGGVLNSLLGISNSRSFLDGSLARIREDASLKTGLTEMFHGHHSHTRFDAFLLPWANIYLNYYTSTPIPENLAAIADAKESLAEFRNFAVHHRELYESLQSSVKRSAINGNSIAAGGLSVSILADGQPVTPQMVSPDSSTVKVGDALYYNGLPADRASFPTALLREGSKLGLVIRNDSQDVLMVTPTLNGMPFEIESLSFSFPGFQTSSFPVNKIEPRKIYLGPGEEVKFAGVHCNGIAIAKKDSGAFSDQIGMFFNDLAPIAPYFDLPFRASLTEGDKRILKAQLERAGGEMDAFIDSLIDQSRISFLNDFVRRLKHALTTDVLISRPLIADDKASSELPNPMLGSIGINVIKVTNPPVEARHTIDFGAGNRDSFTRTFGASGLATVSGGADRIAAKKAYSGLTHLDMIHNFDGFYPINLMSAGNPA